MASTAALPRLAIAAPGRTPWSETFIAAHIERLAGTVLVLTGGAPPRVVVGGAPLLRQGWPGRWLDRIEARLRGGRTMDLLRHRIGRVLRDHRVEVVLAEYGTTAAEILEPVRRLGLPLVVHYHGFDAHRRKYTERYHGYREVFAHASALVVVSRAMEAALLALGAPREKVVLNPYGIDVQRFIPGAVDASPPHLVAIGRFTAKKAPQLTLRAFRLALDRLPHARLTIAGHGKLWDECRDLIAALGLAHAVDLPGIVPQERVAELMRSARAFVQHSITTDDGDMEGTPLAVLEAMACGLPVVATRHAGIADTVEHGVSGLLCEEHDVEAMAANMIEVLTHAGRAAALGRKGRSHVEAHHRVEQRVAVLQGILHRAAARQPVMPA